MSEFLIDTGNEPALGPIEKDRYVFCCSNGCGECKAVLVTMRTYLHTENGRVVNERFHPDIVSSCCGEPMFVYDQKRDEDADPAFRTVSIELPAPIKRAAVT